MIVKSQFQLRHHSLELATELYRLVDLCVDADGTVRCSHGLKTQWGFPQLFSLKNFRKRSNGFLVDDSCTLGAEVYVIKPSSGTKESLNLWKNPPSNTQDWTFHNWSTLGPHQDSPTFYIGRRNRYIPSTKSLQK